MSAFQCNTPNGILVYLPSGQQAKIAGSGDTIEASRLNAAQLSPVPGASGQVVQVNSGAAVPFSTGAPSTLPGSNPQAPFAPNWSSGQLGGGATTTFPGISAASIIAATPGLQAQINAGVVTLLTP
jgi:hypothetical protein